MQGETRRRDGAGRASRFDFGGRRTRWADLVAQGDLTCSGALVVKLDIYHAPQSPDLLLGILNDQGTELALGAASDLTSLTSSQMHPGSVHPHGPPTEFLLALTSTSLILHGLLTKALRRRSPTRPKSMAPSSLSKATIAGWQRKIGRCDPLAMMSRLSFVVDQWLPLRDRIATPNPFTVPGSLLLDPLPTDEQAPCREAKHRDESEMFLAL